MSKQKRFQPPAGFIVAVHQNILGCEALGKELNLPAGAIAYALERAGFMLVADPMDISADAAKVIDLSHRNKREVVVNESGSDSTND